MPFAISITGPTARCGLIFSGYLGVVMLPMICFRRATAVSWLLSCQKWMRQKAGVIFLGLRQIFCVIDGVAEKSQTLLTQQVNPVKMTLRRGQMCAGLLSS